MGLDMRAYFVLCVYLLSVLGCSYCWIFNVRPGEYVCTPLNFLCSYSEECCMGVCYRRTYLKYIKIRQCTLGNKIIGFPKEEELNYLGTKEMRKLVHDRSTERGHVKGEIEIQYDKEYGQKNEKVKDPDEPLNIYKPVAIPIPTTKSSIVEEVTPVCEECEEQKLLKLAKDFENFRVDKNSSMYGGPLNLTGNFSMPLDNLHQQFLTPCSDCEKNNSFVREENNSFVREKNNSFVREKNNSFSESRTLSSTERVSYLFGYRINPAGDRNFQKIENVTTVVETSREFNLTQDEIKEFEDFTDLYFLKPTLESTTVSNEMKAAQIKENLESFVQNEEIQE